LWCLSWTLERRLLYRWESEVIQALDLVVPLMNLGEEALVQVREWGHPWRGGSCTGESVRSSMERRLLYRWESEVIQALDLVVPLMNLGEEALVQAREWGHPGPGPCGASHEPWRGGSCTGERVRSSRPWTLWCLSWTLERRLLYRWESEVIQALDLVVPLVNLGEEALVQAREWGHPGPGLVVPLMNLGEEALVQAREWGHPGPGPCGASHEPWRGGSYAGEGVRSSRPWTLWCLSWTLERRLLYRWESEVIQAFHETGGMLLYRS
jgi:hypothetical protein